MILSTFLFSALIACGEKTNDTASTTDTGATEDTGDTNNPQDTGDTNNPQDTGDTNNPQDTGDTNNPQDTGDTGIPNDNGNGENNSETPPDGSCLDNTVQMQTAEETYILKYFIWDMEVGDEGPVIFVAGYNSGTVEVCNGLATGDPLNYAQVNLTMTPNLSQLPQTIGLGVMDVTENIAGELMFLEETGFLSNPEDPSSTFYISLEGGATINSFIEGEKSLISDLQVGQMGVLSSDFTDFDEIDVQLQNGTNVISCYCSGLIDYYRSLDPGPPE